jgi:multiple sugar transport system permease protein
MKKRLGTLEKKNRGAVFLFLSPWIIGLLVFTLYPVISSLYFSLTQYTVVKPPKFTGFDNYVKLLQDKTYLTSLWNSLYMVLFGVTITSVLTIMLSIILNNRRIQGLSFFRVLFFLPTLVPVVIVSILWIWILQPDTGIINNLLGVFGITGPGWIASPLWSKPSFILMMIWSSGGSIIIYLAGLQEIPETLYESAMIEGANFFQKTVFITLPMLSPVILFNVITAIIGVLQWFAEPFIITSGGPDNSTLFYALYLYQNAFQFFKMGYASAMAWVLLVIVLILILILFRMNKKFGYTES